MLNILTIIFVKSLCFYKLTEMFTKTCFWTLLLLSVVISTVIGQQRADGVGFIPRTTQNAIRVQQRFNVIEHIKQMQQKAGINPNQKNNPGGRMNNNNMGGAMNNHNMGGGPNNGGGFIMDPYNGFGNGGQGGNFGGSGGMGNNMNFANMNAEQIEAVLDHRRQMGFGMYNAEMGMGPGYGMGLNQGAGGYTIINTDLMSNAAENGLMLGMMGNGGMAGNNVGTMGNGQMATNNGGNTNSNKGNGTNGRYNRKRKGILNLPPCQPLYECSFIPPQCRTWMFDTVNSMMCRKCPVNRCEGGAKEMFNTMYEYHPQRVMYEALTGR